MEQFIVKDSILRARKKMKIINVLKGLGLGFLIGILLPSIVTGGAMLMGAEAPLLINFIVGICLGGICTSIIAGLMMSTSLISDRITGSHNLKKISNQINDEYSNRNINIHPNDLKMSTTISITNLKSNINSKTETNTTYILIPTNERKILVGREELKTNNETNGHSTIRKTEYSEFQLLPYIEAEMVVDEYPQEARKTLAKKLI